MIKTIIGVLLLLVPFLLINKFKNKKLGFFYILSFLLAFHLSVAIITQFFGIFNYWVVIGINSLACLAILIKTDYKLLRGSAKKIKIDWVLVFIIIILFIQFFHIHYNYAGTVTTTIENYKEVSGVKYPYPYFSDEWSAVSFIQYSLDSGKLPLVNPLWYNAAFPNLELPFHSFVSEMMMVLGLNPVTQYTILTIFTGLLICLLVYFILRFNKISKLAASVACLSIPYIINGANLPGLWTLIPLIMGLISMLLGFLFISTERKGMILFMAFLTLIFYPPLFVLYSVALIFYLIYSEIPKKEKIKTIKIYFGICIVLVLLLSLFAYFNREDFISYIFSKIFYETFTRNAIPDFTIWKVVPIPIILLAIFGGFKIFRKKAWLVSTAIVGLMYWWLYSFMLWRFIIEYERVVLSTSILMMILSGFGLHYLLKYLKKLNFIRKYKILKIVQVLVLVLFFIFAFSYTQRENWQDLNLHNIKGTSAFKPASPANMYLHPDDLKLFEDIEGKRFLALPWKGTVIGVATKNYPLDTKSATITNKFTSYSGFMSADCEKKIEIMQENEIDYIYGKEIECKEFEELGVSEEGWHLYIMKSGEGNKSD